MPGIYTHNVIFKKAIDKVSTRIQSDHLYKSMESFFRTNNHMKAGLFGAIGPNIFDYMDYFSKKNSYGNEISFYLHDKASISYVKDMVDVIYEGRDIRSEWSSEQKAYLMGYVSHLIGDAILHPYILYSSGFPSGVNKNNFSLARGKNLLFEYNIDNYYIYKDEETSNWKLDIEDMLFVVDDKKKNHIENSVKVLILKSLMKNNMEMACRNFKSLSGKNIDGDIGKVSGFDKIPERIRLAYKVKRESESKSAKIALKLKNMNLLNSDFFINYPPAKRVDEDAINLHRGRWQFPCVDKKVRYETVPQLVETAVDKIVDAWLEIETMSYGNNNINIESFLDLNSYTGIAGANFSEMDTQEPVRLKF